MIIHDGYRPWYVTKIFWDATPDDKKIFVADPAEGSKHNRGCAVDLSLYDLKTGKEASAPPVRECDPLALPADPPANEERAQFRNSLTDEDRSQIEERIQQLVDDLPALSSTNARTLGSNEARPSVSTEVLDEYYFLRDIVGWWINPMLRKRVSSRLFPAALCQNFHVRMVAAQFVENLIGG